MEHVPDGPDNPTGGALASRGSIPPCTRCEERMK